MGQNNFFGSRIFDSTYTLNAVKLRYRDLRGP